MTLSTTLANRLGFIVLGLTNNFAYIIMLSAAYDLLQQSETTAFDPQATSATRPSNSSAQKYCHKHSTSTILLADTIPSLVTKLLYPCLLVGVPNAYKATATALLSAVSFLVTGLSTDRMLIFIGVACASLSSGLGESTYLSSIPLYGDESLSGWSMGTGLAGLVGSIAYATLRMVLSIEYIMILMLVIPIAMMLAYFNAINLVDGNTGRTQIESREPTSARQIIESAKQAQRQVGGSPSEERTATSRESSCNIESSTGQAGNQVEAPDSSETSLLGVEVFDRRSKFRYLPTLSRYFLPLLVVHVAEYFINQGLLELIYYPEVTFLDHAAQNRWFQVSYQFGVWVSRSSLDLIQIRQLWTMSLLQCANAVLFLAHAAKLIHIPGFYTVILIVVYEGLLAGLSYSNTFYRMSKELAKERQEFAISTVLIADTLGIIIAGAIALPAHDALCKLYP